MVKNNQEQTNVEQEQVQVNEEKQKHGLKKSTIIIGGLLLGVAVVWGVLGYQTVFQNSSESFFGRYFQDKKHNDIIVATIDGKSIYLSEIKDIADRIPQYAELPFDMIYPQLLKKYIIKEVVYKSAQDSEIQKNPMVQTAIQEATETIISKAYMDKKINELMTPEKLKELYLTESRNMPRNDEIHARHILVHTEKEAKNILLQLEAGADFIMLANAKSIEETTDGGDLGYFQKNMMIPDFGEAVFALKKGELSKPIKTPFGWHIVYIEDRRLAELPKFEEVQDQLKLLFVERNLQEILEQEKVKHNVKILVETLKPQAPSETAINNMQPDTQAQSIEEADKALAPVQEETQTVAKTETSENKPTEQPVVKETDKKPVESTTQK